MKYLLERLNFTCSCTLAASWDCKWLNAKSKKLPWYRLWQKMRLTEPELSQDELTNANVSFISALHIQNERKMCVVPLQNILYKCVYVEIVDKPNIAYACKMPNQLEQD